MGGGEREVAHDGGGTVAGAEQDGAAGVAGVACEDFADACGTLGTQKTAFDLLPGAAEEALLLDILLEHTDGEVAQFLRQITF